MISASANLELPDSAISLDVELSNTESGSICTVTSETSFQGSDVMPIYSSQDICYIKRGNSAMASLSGTSSFESSSSNPGEHKNILRRLLSQRQPPEEIDYVSSRASLEQHFAGTMPFLPSHMSDLVGFDHRPRCQSVGASNLLYLKQGTCTSSRDSLDSMNDSYDPSFDCGYSTNTRYTENQIEATRTKLMSLTTDCSESDMSLMRSTGRNSSSQPGSPPRAEMLIPDRMIQHRKYSEGSQLKARLQALRMGFRTPADNGQQLNNGAYGNIVNPVDLTCRRRRKFEGMTGLPYGRRVSMVGHMTSNCSVDEGIDDDSCSESSSILKSILTGRERSNTISVCGLRSSTDPVSDLDSRRFFRQPVTLAKKNLHPVLAKISDCLSRITTFTRTLQEFSDLPVAEQQTLMIIALPRLLLLFMAECNVHFVVAPVLQHNKMDEFIEENKDSDDSGGSALSASVALNSVDNDRWQLPTLQFAECVKNFISKCQSLAISQEEYHHMRVIALFHSVGKLSQSVFEVCVL